MPEEVESGEISTQNIKAIVETFNDTVRLDVHSNIEDDLFDKTIKFKLGEYASFKYRSSSGHYAMRTTDKESKPAS